MPDNFNIENVQPEEVKTPALLEEIEKTKEVLDLAIIGILNEEYTTSRYGLYWISERYFQLVKELVKRAEEGFEKSS